MYLLAVDTATNAGGAALSRNEEVVGLVMLKTPLRYSDCLIDTVDFLLAQHGLALKDVGCLAAAAGPGSFTGVRIGLAALKAFGQALSIPAVGISTLEALAWRFRDRHHRVAPMIDARRQQVYAAAYDVRDREMTPLAPEEAVFPSRWLKKLPPGEFLFVGDGARLYQGAVAAQRPESRALAVDNCILTELCQLGFQRFCAGSAAPVGQLKANYVRPSDAELSAVLG